MLSKEQYDYYKQFELVINLFQKTGEYVGGCEALFDYMKIADRSCSSCKAAALIEAYNGIQGYERNM